jgi:hypothetical protein
MDIHYTTDYLYISPFRNSDHSDKPLNRVRLEAKSGLYKTAFILNISFLLDFDFNFYIYSFKITV